MVTNKILDPHDPFVPIQAGPNKVQAAPPADWEVEKARATARRSLVGSLQSSLGRAIVLSQDALFYNDPGRINRQAERISSVTVADVQRVARQYLTAANRSVVITVPKPAASRGGE